MPHIIADNEVSAWYALGYEQARDGLLWIQYACKAAKGELTWVRGDGGGVQNDMAVQILGSHLGGLSDQQLRTLMAPANQAAISANFWDNCIAFADGADAYRAAVEAAAGTPTTREGKLRTWLSSHRFILGQPDLRWVYEHPIEAVDIASQGALTSAFWNFFRAEISIVNSTGAGYTISDDPTSSAAQTAVDPNIVGNPLDPVSALNLLESMRQYAGSGCGMAGAMSGSNSFGWWDGYC
ncbi:MAG: penicillin acylase family protein, partial [Planctomycetes bacterium]|nr:penicillin acylase family protein [Planctomycetota bacterium]